TNVSELPSVVQTPVGAAACAAAAEASARVIISPRAMLTGPLVVIFMICFLLFRSGCACFGWLLGLFKSKFGRRDRSRGDHSCCSYRCYRGMRSNSIRSPYICRSPLHGHVAARAIQPLRGQCRLPAVGRPRCAVLGL